MEIIRKLILKRPYATLLTVAFLTLAMYVVAERFFVPTLNDSCASNYAYINPEPDCETFESKTKNVEELNKILEEEIKTYEQKNEIDKIAVFARDLTTRRFVGVNENDIFEMASLLKVPLAITYFKLAEVAPESLDQRILYEGSPNLYPLQRIQPQEKLVPGESYTVKELISRALSYSDNTAAEILAEQPLAKLLNDVLTALSIRFEKPAGEQEDLITAKSYANIFRILYNSSYLTRDFSNEILKMLTETSYKDGAVMKLPASLAVAHKFGERSLYDTETKELMFYQLHDCGIVYAKNGKEPYTFCIMTQGKNFETMQNAIQDLSLSIYQGITEGK